MTTRRLREYFNYTKRERNGIIVLLLILIVLIVLNIYFNNKNFGDVVVYDQDFEKEIENFEASLKLKDKKIEKDSSLTRKKIKRKKQTWKKVDSLFVFDPNTINKTNLRKLGFNDSQVKTIIKFRDKGGVFYQKEDLLKIYGIKEDQYNYLEHYIQIENVKTEKDSSSTIVRYIFQVELNSAKIQDLTKLKGIGESYANRIIKYRDLLGGFYNFNQLYEIYGMDTLRIQNNLNSIQIDTSLVKKININKVKFKTLLRHPYLNKYQTQSIMKYREISGEFTHIEQLLEYNLLGEDDFIKIKPYITIKD